MILNMDRNPFDTMGILIRLILLGSPKGLAKPFPFYVLLQCSYEKSLNI